MDTWVLYTKPASEDGPEVPIIQTYFKESTSSRRLASLVWVSWAQTVMLGPAAPGFNHWEIVLREFKNKSNKRPQTIAYFCVNHILQNASY